MKRDARIGLAVVLVLGLSVTMLIGRALYKRGGSAADGDESFAAENYDSGSGETANANRLVDPPAANTNQPQTSGLGLLNPEQQRLLEAQSHQLNQPNTAAGTSTTPVRRGDPTPDLDHESPGPVANGSRPAAPHTTTDYYAYTVVNGDSPWSVANKIYGDGKYTQKIVDANELGTKKMKSGMVLKIPAIESKFKIKLQPFADSGTRTTHDVTGGKPVAADNHSPAPTAAKSTYKIETGDTLAAIAKKHYGSSGPKTIQLIVAANHGLDPAKLKVGQEIALPAVK